MTYKEYLEHSKKVKISKNFTQYQICHSDKASILGIDNTPTPEIIQNATILIKNVLEPVVSYYKKPLSVSCMFRCKELNKASGGAATSQHLLGQACDFTIIGIDCKKIFNDIISGKITFGKTNLKDIIDQCIYEVRINKDKSKTIWLHISYSTKVRRKQFITSLNGKYITVTKEI